MWEGISGEGAVAEGHQVDAFQEILQAEGVALPGPGVAEQPVAPAGGLGGLEMGIARHEESDFGCGALYGDADEGAQLLLRGFELFSQPEPEVGRDLIVAAAAGVQFSGYGADQFGQAAFVGGVDVLVAGLNFKLTGAPFSGNKLEAGDDLFGLLLGQEPGCGQRAGVGLAAADVGQPQAPVEVDRRVELFHQRIECAAEAASPQLRAHCVFLRTAVTGTT